MIAFTRTGAEQIAACKSCGFAVQEQRTVLAVARAARELGVGTEMAL
jgi:ornithine cyclodeaminase/alanine dehydrogenase-like protein (mu-crystallin family)